MAAMRESTGERAPGGGGGVAALAYHQLQAAAVQMLCGPTEPMQVKGMLGGTNETNRNASVPWAWPVSPRVACFRDE